MSVANRENVPPALKAEVLARCDWACFYCGKESRLVFDGYVWRWEDLEVEHVTPRWFGGPNLATNLVAACKGCNGMKGATIPPPEVGQWVRDLVSWDPTPDPTVPDRLRVVVAPRPERAPLRERGSQRRGYVEHAREVQCPECQRWLTVTGEVIVVGGEVGVVFVMACLHCQTEWEVDSVEQ